MSTTPEPDELALAIAGRTYRFWTEMEVVLSMDSPATVLFSAPFEAERQEFRETFRPFSYQAITVRIGKQPLFTGTMIGVDPHDDGSARSVSVSGYSLPGVLDDCEPPASAYPLEFNGMKLRQIAETLCGPFNLTVDFRGTDGAAFSRVALENHKLGPGQKIKGFLAELARQRGFVLASSPVGALLIWQSTTTGKPVARLNGQPALSVTPAFSPQDYYSELTGRASAKAGRRGSRYTETNPHLSGILRPMSAVFDDTPVADVPAATKAKLARMFGNIVSYEVPLPTWRDPSGALWQPNTTVTLTAPDAMIYHETEFVIRKVTLRQGGEKKAKTASLELVLPGAFSGGIPTRLPWQE